MLVTSTNCTNCTVRYRFTNSRLQYYCSYSIYVLSINVTSALKLHCNITTARKLLRGNSKRQDFLLKWTKGIDHENGNLAKRRESCKVYLPKLQDKLLSIMFLFDCYSE